LEIMKLLEEESVDLIYLDPPFFSNKNYEVVWGDDDEVRSFKDRWAGGMEHYIGWLKERVVEMHRILKPTGSIFLHCDWHADAYIRVDILDKVFGMGNFRNEIIWKRTNAKSNATKSFAVLVDTIFFYSKSDKFKLNLIRGDYSQEQMLRYKQQDGKGVYRCDDLTAPGKGRQFIWRGVHPGNNRSWRFSEEAMEELITQDLIVYQKDGRPRKDGLKKYLSETEGALIGNLWDDIDRVANTSAERIGYPTQKPKALLDRIIKCASDEGDIVLDPFVGGGTTCAVAHRLNRIFIGIDQSYIAVKVTEQRLNKQASLFADNELDLRIIPPIFTEKEIAKMTGYEFQKVVIEAFGGRCNKRGADGGIDGWKGNCPIQVKHWKHAVSSPDIQKLHSVILTSKVNKGYFIADNFSKQAVDEIARVKQQGITIERVRPDEIADLKIVPNLSEKYKLYDKN